MIGASGTYAINNTDLTLQPTTGKWVERSQYGVDGAGHPIYSSFRSFELNWDLISPSQVKQLIDFYNTVSATGTVVACLPKWGDTDYVFFNYSGSTLGEPVVDTYFQGYLQSVKLLVLNIRT